MFVDWVRVGFEIVVLTGTIVWSIGKMRMSADVLNAQLRALCKSVDRLRDAIEDVRTRQDAHAERITRLEARQDD